jgi:hypothetical protein
VDFVNITHVIDRMQHAFFREAPPAR